MSAKKITLKQFEDAIKGVLLAKLEKRAKYENHKPTSKELNQKWKLEKRKL